MKRGLYFFIAINRSYSGKNIVKSNFTTSYIETTSDDFEWVAEIEIEKIKGGKIMAKFDNAKVGDKVWHIIHGWGEIVHINKDEIYGITVRFTVPDGSCRFDDTYTFGGFACTGHKCPSIYWNEIKLPTDKEDKKPFDLVDFLKENLEPEEFEYEGNNYTLIYDYNTKALYTNIDILIESTFPYFKSISFDVLGTLNENKITMKQLKEAYRKLGWI